jgi:hypothetical protein
MSARLSQESDLGAGFPKFIDRFCVCPLLLAGIFISGTIVAYRAQWKSAAPSEVWIAYVPPRDKAINPSVLPFLRLLYT